MYLIISGIMQLILVVLIYKSIDKLRERTVYLEVNEEVLEDRLKRLEEGLDNVPGIARMDELSRISIPRRARKELNIDVGNVFTIYKINKGIILKKIT